MARFLSNLKLSLVVVLAGGAAAWALSCLYGDAGWMASWPANGLASPAALGFALAIAVDRTD